MGEKKILLITGASGFIGTWLAETAFLNGYVLIGVDIQVPKKPYQWLRFATASCETVDIDELLKGISLFGVCHLAGSASVASSVLNPYADFYSLLPGTAKLASYLAKHQQQARLYFFSSAAVYGNPEKMPITESTIIAPISPYGIHKAVAEDLLQKYSSVYNFGVTVFRIFSVYGEGLKKQMIWDVSQKATIADRKGEKSITLYGTGEESRDFLYIEDLCAAILGIFNTRTEVLFDIYNLGTGIEIKIKDIASLLVHHLEAKVNIDFNGQVQKGDPTNWNLDISKLKSSGFTPHFTIDNGLSQIAKWIRSIEADFK